MRQSGNVHYPEMTIRECSFYPEMRQSGTVSGDEIIRECSLSRDETPAEIETIHSSLKSLCMCYIMPQSYNRQHTQAVSIHHKLDISDR